MARPRKQIDLRQLEALCQIQCTLADLPAASGVYWFLCQGNQKVYVGSSVDIRYRIRKHLQAARKGQHSSPLFQRSFVKYGEHSFLYAVLELCPREELIKKEQQWLDFYRASDPEYGLNILPRAASPQGRTFTPEQRQAMKGRGKGRRIVFTDEWRRNIARSRLGKSTSAYQKQRVSEANKGKKVSEETRKRLSLALKGRKHSAQHIARLPQNQGGENHPRAKFTWEQVQEIRQLCLTQRTSDIAKMYSVKGYVISQIKHGHTWKDGSFA